MDTTASDDLYTSTLYHALHARHRYLFECNDTLCLGSNDESDYSEHIRQIVQLIHHLHRGEPYKTQRKSGKTTLTTLTTLGKELHTFLQIPFTRLYQNFHASQFHPYVQLAQAAAEAVESGIEQGQFPSGIKQSGRYSIKAADCMAEVILQGREAEGLRREVRNRERAARKNARSLAAYIDALFEAHARLLVIRLDLRYSEAYLKACGGRLDAEQVRQDFQRFLRRLHTGRLKADLRGLVWKLEFGPTRQFHYHIALFLDGSRCREDVSIARELGELWQQEITEGNGDYFNCNARQARYRKPALGMINWYEQTRREYLQEAMSYLVKVDLLINPVLPRGARTFGKGIKPAPRGTLGRPRQHRQPAEWAA